MKSCPLITASIKNGWTDSAYFFLNVCNIPNEGYTGRKIGKIQPENLGQL